MTVSSLVVHQAWCFPCTSNFNRSKTWELKNLTDKMAWNGLICKRNWSGETFMLKCHILMTYIYWTSSLEPFLFSVPLIEKPCSWFIPAKSVKTHAEEWYFSNKTGQRSASLLEMSFFQRCFSHILLVEINNPVCS